MRFPFGLLLVALTSVNFAQESQSLEAPYTPFDFDNYRRTPLQARQTSVSWASKDNGDLQRSLISGEQGKTKDISTRASALFPDPQEIPIRQESEPIPTPNQLTDEITASRHGETTKGQRDLLARSRVADRLGLSSMSESDYELYVARYRADQEPTPSPTGEALLRPMPTLVNSKTGGPPHAYAVSQAGVGARRETRNEQNPFEDLIRALRLNQPVTRGNDPLPVPTARLTVASTPAGIPGAEGAPASPEEPRPESSETNP